MAVAPKTFGTLSGTLLVSNNTTMGNINGFNRTTGKLMGTVKNSAGKAIAISGLWGIEFGGGSSFEREEEPVVLYGGAERYERVLRGDQIQVRNCCAESEVP